MARWLAFVVWAAVAASAAFWGSKLIVPATQPRAGVATPVPGPLGDLSRLLGAPPPSKPGVATPTAGERARFQLIGVIAASDKSSASDGFALIAVDGQRARSYRVGAMLDSDWALRAVQTRGVSIAPRNGEAAISLELPPLPWTATGQLPPAGLNDARAGTHVNAPKQVPVTNMRPALSGDGAPQDRAPNTMLNNPADMAPADAGSQETPTRR